MVLVNSWVLEGLLPFCECKHGTKISSDRSKSRKHLEIGTSNLICSVVHDMRSSRLWSPLITGVKGTPGSLPCISACFTSSGSVPLQMVLSAVVSLRAVLHYPASVSAPLHDWPHLNMPRHHLLLNGPLWSKCQTGKLLKKKCSHLLSWHFPQRLIPSPPPPPPSPLSSRQESQQRPLFYPH